MIDQKKRAYFIIGFVAFVAILLLWTIYGFLNNGRLVLTAPKTTPNDTSVDITVFREDATLARLSLKPGETKSIKLSPGAVRVDAKAGTLRAIDVVSIKRFNGSTPLTTPAAEQRSVRQLATDADPCAVSVGGTTYSYPCLGDGPILKHTTNTLGGSLSSVAFNKQSFSQLKPYKDGLLGFYTTPLNPTEILYINLVTQTIQPLPLTRHINDRLKANYATVTTTGDAADEHFSVTIRETNELYLFADNNDTSPQQLKLPDGANTSGERRISGMSFSDDSLMLYLGESHDEGEGTFGNQQSKPEPLDAFLLEYTFDGALRRTIDLAKGTDAQNIYKLGNGFYAARFPTNVTFYSLDGDTLTARYTMNDMGAMGVIDDTAYFEVQGVVYRFETGENNTFGLHGIYASDDFSVTDIFTGAQGKILISAMSEVTDDNSRIIYELSAAAGGSTEKQTEPVFNGMDSLLDVGLSADQLANTRFALGNYLATRPETIKKVDIPSVTVPEVDRFSTSTVSAMTFQIILNDSIILNARLEYFDLMSIRLYLNDFKGNPVYDSQNVTNQLPR